MSINWEAASAISTTVATIIAVILPIWYELKNRKAQRDIVKANIKDLFLRLKDFYSLNGWTNYDTDNLQIQLFCQTLKREICKSHDLNITEYDSSLVYLDQIISSKAGFVKKEDVDDLMKIIELY